MIRTVYIKNIDGVMDLIKEQEFNTQIGRIRSSYFFRGIPNVDFKLETSLARNCKELQSELEPAILRSFTKYAIRENPDLSRSVWRQMIIGQHHSLPTRLMDWTRSPLIALHFATEEDNFDDMDKHDSVVWRFDIREASAKLPEKYRAALDRERSFVFSLENLNSVCDSLEQYDSDMGARSFVNIEPPSLEQRIISQYSFFSVVPMGITDMQEWLEKNTQDTVRFVIKSCIRWKVRDLMDQFNINERIVYPGLSGLSRSIARHYFVRIPQPDTGECGEKDN